MSAKNEQIEAPLSRREWLARTLQWSIAGTLFVFAAGCHKQGRIVCADPQRLSDEENNLRTSLHYTDDSPQTSQVCVDCAFFVQAQGGSCGTCNLLKGPVNPKGHCDSWSKASA